MFFVTQRCSFLIRLSVSIYTIAEMCWCVCTCAWKQNEKKNHFNLREHLSYFQFKYVTNRLRRSRRRQGIISLKMLRMYTHLCPFFFCCDIALEDVSLRYQCTIQRCACCYTVIMCEFKLMQFYTVVLDRSDVEEEMPPKRAYGDPRKLENRHFENMIH